MGNTSLMEIIPLGDSALTVSLVDDFATDPIAATNAVLRAQHALARAAIPGVVDIVPAYTSIGVFFDPTSLSLRGTPSADLFAIVKERIEVALSSAKRHSVKGKARLVAIPVCYEDEYAPDVAEVARAAGLTSDQVGAQHCGAEYTVVCLGFMPGFGYLSGLPADLATPRRQTPRKEVPAGSVAIGGSQTGVYPAASPGGWNIIGRTPLRMFDPRRHQPAVLASGDRVRFRSITSAEFDSFRE